MFIFFSQLANASNTTTQMRGDWGFAAIKLCSSVADCAADWLTGWIYFSFSSSYKHYVDYLS